MTDNPKSGSVQKHYRDICPNCPTTGDYLGHIEIEGREDKVDRHYRCPDCGTEWYCPTGETRSQDTGSDR